METKFSTEDDVVEEISADEVTVSTEVVVEPTIEDVVEKKEIKATPKNVPVKNYPSSKAKGKKKKKK